jgi:tetratricopeptide (TPR) repeat protein
MDQRIIPILLLLFLAIVLVIPGVHAEDALEWYMKGENAVIVGKYTESITYYNNAIALDQKYAAALSGKAYALKQMENYSEALEASDRALTIKNDGRALNVRAYALLKLGRYDESVTAYDKLFITETNLPEAYCNQGIAYEHLNKTDQALLAFDSCVRLDPGNVFGWNKKGLVLLALGKPQEALDAFNQCTRITVKNAEIWNNKGLALLQLGKYQDALECFNKALGIDPTYAAAKQNKELAMNKGQVYGGTGMPQQTTKPVTATTISEVTLTVTETTVIPTQAAGTVTATPEQTGAAVVIKGTYTPLPVWGAIAGVFGAGIIALVARKQK